MSVATPIKLTGVQQRCLRDFVDADRRTPGQWRGLRHLGYRIQTAQVLEDEGLVEIRLIPGFSRLEWEIRITDRGRQEVLAA